MAISDGQREVLEALVRSRSAAHRVVQRAQVLLLAGDGVSNSEISEVVGVSRPTVLAWRSDFEKDGLGGFGEVAKGVGVSPASVRRIWSARGLKPHLVKTFKLSNDRHFETR